MRHNIGNLAPAQVQIQNAEKFIWTCSTVQAHIERIKEGSTYVLIPDGKDPKTIPYEAMGKTIRLAGGLGEICIKEHRDALLTQGYKAENVEVWYNATLFCDDFPENES